MDLDENAVASTRPPRTRALARHLCVLLVVASAVAVAGCGAAATPATPTGPQSAIGQNIQIADGTQARLNAQTVSTALAGCTSQNADASNGGVGSCSAADVEASDPNTTALFTTGARAGGVVLRSGAEGASTITAYAAIPGTTALRTYSMVRDSSGAARNTCAPADPTACPNGQWPGG